MSDTWEVILNSPTPKAWIERALNSLEILLIDHAQCEKKAASSALSLIHRYPHYNLAKALCSSQEQEIKKAEDDYADYLSASWENPPEEAIGKRIKEFKETFWSKERSNKFVFCACESFGFYERWIGSR